MKFQIIFLLTLFVNSYTSKAQDIEYSIPDGYSDHVSKKEYKILVNESVEIIQKRYKIKSVKEGVVELEKGQDFSMLNLHNLIVHYSQTPKGEKIEVIKRHFQSGMFQSIEDEKKIDVPNFEKVKKYLSIRVYESSFVEQVGDPKSLVFKEDIEGTITLLMLDLPTAFKSVEREEFKLWGKSEEEVFSIAQSNVNKHSIIKESMELPMEKGDPVTVYFLEEENYCASYMLDLQNNAPDLVGEWGAVVNIPNKGIASICLINKENPVDFVKYIERFHPLTEEFYDHPQPISKDFYWYYQGVFTKINIEMNNGSLKVIAPLGLAELMSK